QLQDAVALAARRRRPVDRHLVLAHAQLHGCHHRERRQRERQAGLVREHERLVPLPPVLHQRQVGVRARGGLARHSARGPAIWLPKHTTPFRESAATVGSGSRNRPITAPPSPPAPVSLAPSAPAPRSRCTIWSIDADDSPSAESTPCEAFIASP